MNHVSNVLTKIFLGLSESPIEEYMKSSFDELEIPVRQQVWVADRRLDFIFSENINIETDGRAFHHPKSDRVRDIKISSFGYRIIRVDGTVIRKNSLVVAAFIVYVTKPEMLKKKFLQLIPQHEQDDFFVRLFIPKTQKYLTVNIKR